MQRRYFVSFVHSDRDGFGFSSVVVAVNGPMTERALEQSRESIARQYPGETIAILNFQPLHTPTPGASV